MATYVRWFNTLTLDDVGLVGGKNASLGEMIQALSKQGVTIPDGFAITADAYRHYLQYNTIEQPLRHLMKTLRPNSMQSLQKVGKAARALIATAQMPSDLQKEIIAAYKTLCPHVKNCDVAVRSSATAEDLPTASFAGQQETFLNVEGEKELLQACKKSMASLFTDRAIIYRIEQGFDHFEVALSVGVQKMIRSDKSVSGVAFSLDTETGFKDVIMIDAAYGLGESIVQGIVNPDEYYVFKTTLAQGYKPIIKKQLGDKKVKMIYSQSKAHPVKKIAVLKKDQERFALTDAEILALAKMVHTIDIYYSKRNKRWMPMDVEWAKDGIDGKIYIVQARPETIHGNEKRCVYATYALSKKPSSDDILTTGLSIGKKIVSGIARVVKSAKDIEKVAPGEIIVTQMTDPDWVPVMKRSAGIITDLGGRTCHAAIVCRELGTPAIVGTDTATRAIKTGMQITIDTSQGATGFVYKGAIPFKKEEIDCDSVPKAPIPIMVNSAEPEAAFAVSALPVDGVGLARIEYIIANSIKIHPMALLHPEKIESARIKKEIAQLAAAYPSAKDFFVDTLSQGIGTIAAAFYPRPVIVRLSDFKSNEYRNLMGGQFFEQEEANPMIGFRGASRYTHELYQEAFCLEVAAVRKAREDMGLTNLQVMIPFVRTIAEAQGVVDLLEQCGLQRAKDGLKLVMMCEIPSNVLLIEQFAKFFDGFSIGSNDLTQLTLGVDRDSGLLADLFDERDPAVMKMFEMAIAGAHAKKKFIGICGQAPSDYPELSEFLIKKGIDSISLNADSVIPFLMGYAKKR